MSHDAFLAGYGAAQAVPGPLFTFPACLGTSLESAPNGRATNRAHRRLSAGFPAARRRDSILGRVSRSARRAGADARGERRSRR
jgi:hypothetical protein